MVAIIDIEEAKEKAIAVRDAATKLLGVFEPIEHKMPTSIDDEGIENPPPIISLDTLQQEALMIEYDKRKLVLTGAIGDLL